MESVLKILGNLLFVKLLLYAIYDCHDSLDVFVKNVALLKTLESNLALLLWLTFLWFNCGQAFVGDIIHNWRGLLI